jgi:hypothetical protein
MSLKKLYQKIKDSLTSKKTDDNIYFICPLCYTTCLKTIAVLASFGPIDPVSGLKAKINICPECNRNFREKY